MASHPTFGVEEEFLLVDPQTGQPVARNAQVAEYAAAHGVELDLELTTCQVETTTGVLSSVDELRRELVQLRRVTADAAQASGARLLAAGLPPTVPHDFPITDKPRYRQIAERFGMIAHEQGICGAHVHVAVPSRELAIRVSNRLRPWLPLLLALTANSAVYRNADTGYASWRRVLWARWPSAGPPPHFDSVDEYDAVVGMLQQSGAMLDDGMVYWDLRPSAEFPTLEVRVADVPATVDETVLLAALARGCVMTALQEESRREPLRPLSAHALEAAYWRASRDGMAGDAVDLFESHSLVPARQLMSRLIERVRPALEDVGDYELVRDEVARIADEGNGAVRQRRAWQARGDVTDVLDAVADATVAGLD